MSQFAGFNPVHVIERIDWTPEQFSLRVRGAAICCRAIYQIGVK